jgi:sigma-B regulation protein RsbU (phosphoserine phosphatase)
VLNVIQSREQSIASNELHMANAIQEGMLPHNFPAYPERTEFDLYASMTPAKEVGGDFYDFYMPDEDHLVITIADVSGKGVPAALLMMVTKTLLKNRGLSGFRDCSRILTLVNNQLCEANLDMFVTVWLGVLQLSTGELTYANAGHEYPAIRRAGAEFELFKDRHSPPIGCMEGVPYREQLMKLAPGDILYIYTDGVTEAANRAQVFFGEKGLLSALNSKYDGSMEDLDKTVRSCVRKHMNGAKLFDDITMLGLKYNGPKAGGETAKSRELTTRANVAELESVMAFADAALVEAGCPPKVQVQIDVAVEEIFVNIAQYAYAPEEGQARIVVTPDEDRKGVSILFEDQGKPYDPLSHEDPDTTLSADEREIGGLGIFMVKKSMDDVSYEYSDGKNRLTIRKRFE